MNKREIYKCSICNKTAKEILEERPNLNKVYWRKGICDPCFHKLNHKQYYRQYVGDRRTGNLDPESPQAKSDKFEYLTCEVFEVKNLNIENDNYCSPIDHSLHPVLGILQTQGRFYSWDRHGWPGIDFRRDQNKNFGHIIIWCVGEDGNIDRVYIFPKDIVKSKNEITIYKYDKEGYLYENGWYEKYRIRDKELLKRANELWNQILKEEI